MSVFIPRTIHNTVDSKRLLLLVIASLTISILLILRDVVGVNISKFIFVGVVVLSCVWMNYRSIIAFFFFLMPLLNGLPGNYILPIVSLFLLAKKSWLMNLKSYAGFILFCIIELVHYSLYSFPINIPLTIGYLSAFYLLFYLVSADDPSLNYRRCLLSFCMGNVVFLLIILGISVRFGGAISSFLGEGLRIGETKELADAIGTELMINANPNGLGAFAITGAATIFVLYKADRINILWMVIPLFVFLFVGALSLSRTFFLCLALLLVLIVSAKGPINKNSGPSFKGVFIILLIAALLWFAINNSILFDAISGRFAQDDVASGNGRTDILKMYNIWLSQNPLYLLIGTGAVHYQEVANLPSACHNAIQQIVVCYGILGLLFFMVIGYLGFHHCFKHKQFIFLIPFIIIFIAVQASRILNPWDNLYLFIVSFFVMKLGQQTNESTAI